MKKRFVIGSIVIAGCAAVYAYNAYRNSPAVIVRRLSQAEGMRQTTQFSALYAGCIPLGTAVIEDAGMVSFEHDGQVVPARYFRAGIRPNAIINALYKVQARIESFVDQHTGHPFEFRQELSVGESVQDSKRVMYDQVKGIMTLDAVERVIIPGTHDPLSALFFLLQQPLALGTAFDLNINTNQKNYQLLARVSKRRDMRVAGALHQAYCVSGTAQRRDKNSRHKTSFRLWVLDVSPRALVQAEVSTNGGVIFIRALQ